MQDYEGRTFGRLTALRRVGSDDKGARWLCRCDCGNEVTVRGSNLGSGNSKSCGRHRDEAATTHGRTHTSAYWRWRAMIQRCTNPKATSYQHYGGRGIQVCEQWRTFEAFLRDMGEPPAGTTLDRIDNEGPYSPENCRWVPFSRQARSRRDTVMLTAFGRTQPLADWADQLGVDFRVIHTRLRKGWTVERALSTKNMRAKR